MSFLHTKVPSVLTYFGFVPLMHIVKRAHNTAAFVPWKITIIRQATHSNCVYVVSSTSATRLMSTRMPQIIIESPSVNYRYTRYAEMSDKHTKSDASGT